MFKESIYKRITMAEDYPLDFTLQYPPRREYFQDHFRTRLDVTQDIALLKSVLLYVHVPFCQAKCYFCNFAVDVRRDPALHQRYTDMLCEQIRRLDGALPSDAVVPGIDIGGGTPTLLEAQQLTQILDALRPWIKRATTPRPLSIETTPRIAASHPERLAALRAGGVTRISMGVQSVNASTLAAVNRSAQQDMTEQALRNMRDAGFDRINVDVIFGLPDQSIDDWTANVRAVIAMGVDSVTTYDCLYRGKGRALTKRTADKPTPAHYGRLYDASYALLKEAGYHAAYGSVNFSRHAGETGTSPYFEGRLFDHMPYLGTGNYASSMLGDAWFFAPYGVNEWIKQIESGALLPQGDAYALPLREMMAKQILLSLNFGVIDTARFEKRFGAALMEAFGPEITIGCERGWIERCDNGYGVAAGQFCNMPQIRSLFYTDAAAGWLSAHMTVNDKKETKERVAA